MSDKIEEKQVKYYTYGDYLTWRDERRYELIDGVPYMMSAPTWQHQTTLIELSSQIRNYLLGKECKVFAAPFDLRLPEGDEPDEAVRTVLQPDVLVVCDRSRLIKTGYFGVPPFVIEIISPSSTRKDRLYKFNKYEKSGVNEYWIVNTEQRIVDVFILGEDGRYGRPDIYTEEDKVKVSIFPDLTIDLSFLKEFYNEELYEEPY